MKNILLLAVLFSTPLISGVRIYNSTNMALNFKTNYSNPKWNNYYTILPSSSESIGIDNAVNFIVVSTETAT